MNFKRYNLLLWLLAAVAIFSSCNKKFDDHNEIDNPLLAEQLLDKINSNPDLSKFSEYLTATGYDKVLASSKTFTIWAPTNQALQALDPTVINTADKLKLFVGNHIANQLFLTTALKVPFLRIKTLNGKNVTFNNVSVDGSPLTSKDQYVGNGVLHVISTAITPRVSAWEYMMSTNSLQKAELASLTYSFYDLTKAEVTGINPQTGAPIYKPGTGLVSANRFLNRFFTGAVRQSTDISNEDSTFTYIALTDAAYTAEKNKLRKYFQLGSGLSGGKDSTDSVTEFNVIKDLTFNGLLDKESFPATTYSLGDSVKFHLDKNAIVQTVPVSNGVVYVMNSINYELGNGTYDPYTKIKPILIQGEVGTATFQATKTNSRPVRRNSDGTIFTQLRVENHGTSIYWAKYVPTAVNSVTYKVYWRVVRDENLVPVSKSLPLVAGSDIVWYPMRLAFKDIPSATVTTGFNYVAKPGAVPVLTGGTGSPQALDINGKFVFAPDFNEIYLNDYVAGKYYSTTLKSGAAGALPIYLVGNNTTVNGTNTLLLDYIKLVPILP